MSPESQVNHGADPLIRLRNGLEHLLKSNSQDGATDSYNRYKDPSLLHPSFSNSKDTSRVHTTQSSGNLLGNCSA